MNKRYRPSNKSGKNSKASTSGYDSNVFNVQSELVRRVMALNGAQDDESEDQDMTTDGYDSYQISTSAYDDSDEDDSEEDSSDDGIDEAQILAMLQTLQAKKQAKKAAKAQQRKKKYASTTNDEDDFSDDLENLSPSEMTEEQYFEYERRLALKEEKLRAQKARIAESRARAAGSSRNATPSSSSLSLPSTKDKKEGRNYVPYSSRREGATGSTNLTGWETPPGTPPSLLTPAAPPKPPTLNDRPPSRKKKGAEFASSGVTKNGVGTADVHNYPSSLLAAGGSKPSAGGSTASKIEKFERKSSASSAVSTREPMERRKPSIDRKAAPPAGAVRREKKKE